jgi:putative membrane protein
LLKPELENSPKGTFTMHGYDMMSGWGGIWFGPILMFLIPLTLVLLIVWLVKAFASGRSASNMNDANARKILDERYAKGEVDDEEYQRRRSALER